MTKILLVEDDKSLREIYGVRLAAEGYEIVSVGDGEEALTVAIKERPDLIISDVMMPKISGFDMLDILRATPETKDLKVIMMTALSSDDQRARGESLGADRYLVKSQVGIEDVVRTVHEVLGDTPGATNTPAPAFGAQPAPVTEPQMTTPADPASTTQTATPEQPQPTAEMQTMPDLANTAAATSPITPNPTTATESQTPQLGEQQPPAAPEPYPRAIDTPAPEPTVISAPEPAQAPQPTTLPQPVAPFSSPAPASLGEQITAAAQAAAAQNPGEQVPPTIPITPTPVSTPVNMAEPSIPAGTPAVQPVVNPAPQAPQMPVVTPDQTPVATNNPVAPSNISDLINQELQGDTTSPQQ